MSNTFIFTIQYNREGSAIGVFSPLSTTGNPLDTDADGIPDINVGDTISYQYQFIDHGLAQESSAKRISASILTATALPGTTGSPFSNGQMTYDLSNNSNQVVLSNTKGYWQIKGTFTATFSGVPVSFSWDPEIEVGTGTD